MRFIFTTLAILGALALLQDCDSKPPNVPTFATDSGDPEQDVCNNLEAVGCPQPKDCANTFRKFNGLLTRFPLNCLHDARSKAAAIACGGVSCP